jgi:hypothetical protein
VKAVRGGQESVARLFHLVQRGHVVAVQRDAGRGEVLLEVRFAPGRATLKICTFSSSLGSTKRWKRSARSRPGTWPALPGLSRRPRPPPSRR